MSNIEIYLNVHKDGWVCVSVGCPVGDDDRWACKHFDGADAESKGQNYRYPHDYPGHWVQQQYLPDNLRDAQYYTPGDNKNEQAFTAYWQQIRQKPPGSK